MKSNFLISRLSPQVNALVTRLSERNTSKAKVSSSIPSGSDALSVDSVLGSGRLPSPPFLFTIRCLLILIVLSLTV